MIKNNIGRRISEYRKLCKMTQKELADKLGVSNRTVSSWETDRTEPTWEDIEIMARLFKCDISDIAGRTPVNLTFEELKLIGKWRDADDLTKAMVKKILNIE